VRCRRLTSVAASRALGAPRSLCEKIASLPERLPSCAFTMFFDPPVLDSGRICRASASGDRKPYLWKPRRWPPPKRWASSGGHHNTTSRSLSVAVVQYDPTISWCPHRRFDCTARLTKRPTLAFYEALHHWRCSAIRRQDHWIRNQQHNGAKSGTRSRRKSRWCDWTRSCNERSRRQ
jgi:hypothetical protein